MKLERPKTANKVFRAKLKSAVAVMVAYRMFSFGQRKRFANCTQSRSRSQLWSVQAHNSEYTKLNVCNRCRHIGRTD